MSDTYDELDKFYAKNSGGADKGIPQQDFGKFSDQIDRKLAENSPEKDNADVFRECEDE